MLLFATLSPSVCQCQPLKIFLFQISVIKGLIILFTLLWVFFSIFSVLVISLDYNNEEQAPEAKQKLKMESGWCLTSFPFPVECSMFRLIWDALLLKSCLFCSIKLGCRICCTATRVISPSGMRLMRSDVLILCPLCSS